jgi:hypothetical protein
VNNALNAHPTLGSTPNCGCVRENAIHEAYTLTPRTIGVSATWRP